MDERDPAVPEADAAEQAQPWSEEEAEPRLPESIDMDVPEADALDQAREVSLEEDESGGT